MPSSLEITSNINRNFSSQRFRQVYMDDKNNTELLPLPDLQLRNYLFDWSYAINHNLTRSLRFNFTATNNNIVRNFLMEDKSSAGFGSVNKTLGIWDGIWDTGQSDRHFQSLSFNYKIPLRLIPLLSFIDANYNYTGDFNWQRGSNAMASVTNENGEKLGQTNNIENANTKTLTGSISFNRLYNILGLKPKSNQANPFSRVRSNVGNQISEENEKTKKNNTLKKSATILVNLLSSLKRVQFNFSENNGKVIPGYLPNVGFFGTVDPSFGFTFGSQADVRYEVAKEDG